MLKIRLGIVLPFVLSSALGAARSGLNATLIAGRKPLESLNAKNSGPIRDPFDPHLAER